MNAGSFLSYGGGGRMEHAQGGPLACSEAHETVFEARTTGMKVG